MNTYVGITFTIHRSELAKVMILNSLELRGDKGSDTGPTMLSITLTYREQQQPSV